MYKVSKIDIPKLSSNNNNMVMNINTKNEMNVYNASVVEGNE